jgi:chromate reductase
VNVLAFAASNSKQSINKTLATYAAGLIKQGNVEVVDINDFEMPIYSIDREDELGTPLLALAFHRKIADADALIISFAEHNGSYTAAYKNLFDWISRIDIKVFQGKSVVYLATSPGPGGAATVLDCAVTSAPHFGADLKGSISVPSFFDNFDVEGGEITNPEIKEKILEAIQQLGIAQ